ncbi:MAG: thioredoxin domain-containing protein [Candidatus Lokiarchaeota archaeon]|nr:thioredoxin domain-containing protein [Candidatus Lokiarchaeota archaeon]
MQGEVPKEKKPNELIHEKSPYLLQHAYNPVKWHPWNLEMFTRAKTEDKPVFVSIGYSSCHWCHVMEKESFNDSQVAKLMNKAFICIKVDKEERPDLDNIYMKICQIMGRNCGWPLNVIMTPDRTPFFVSSYIPKEDKYGIVGMINLIPQIEQIWKTRKSELKKMGKEVMLRLDGLEQRMSEREIGSDILDDTFEKLFLNFDNQNGGFNRAPKFPIPHNLLFLLRYWKRTKNKNALMMTKKTLQNMRLGGIFDQVGFGLHRYSTDKQWLVPHFEKMLYDQALMAIAYIEAFQVTNEKKFEITAKEILEYVLRDLTSQEGGFYTAEDADSEGVEGKFYLWSEEEIRKTLPSELQELALAIFNLEIKGNYPEAMQKGSGRNILHLRRPLSQVAKEFNISVEKLILKMGKIQKLLLKKREERIRPFKDKKILVDWNGLMIAALAKISRILNKPKYLKAAIKASEFIWSTMKTKKGKLYHRFAKNESAITGFIDDYAFLAWGFLEIYEACFDKKYLDMAKELIEIMSKEFWDFERGGFYFTAKNSENAMPRTKKVHDSAIPSGNSVALLILQRLAILSGNLKYENMAKKMLRIFSEEITISPLGYTFLLIGVDYAIGASHKVTLVGNLNEDSFQNLRAVLNSNYLPNVVVKHYLPEKNENEYKLLDKKATAYICSNHSCKPPTNNADKMLKLLESELNNKG